MNDFRRRPHPAKFPADGCLVLIAALHQTLLHGISRIVVHGKPWREGRENIVEAYRRGRRHRHTAILRKRLAARDECRYDRLPDNNLCRRFSDHHSPLLYHSDEIPDGTSNHPD